MRDQRRDVNAPAFDEAERSPIRRRPAIALESTGGACRREQRRLHELDAIQCTEIDAGVPVAIEQHRCLLPNAGRNRREPPAGAGGLDQQPTPPPARPPPSCTAPADGPPANASGPKTPTQGAARAFR